MRIGNTSKIPDNILKSARIVRNALLRNNGCSRYMCHIASEQLVKILKLLGEKAKLRKGMFIIDEGHCEGHYWVEIHNHILDVTADQFNEYLKTSMKMAAIVYAPKIQLKHLYEKE